jgi:hypothetical protein
MTEKSFAFKAQNRNKTTKSHKTRSQKSESGFLWMCFICLSSRSITNFSFGSLQEDNRKRDNEARSDIRATRESGLHQTSTKQTLFAAAARSLLVCFPMLVARFSPRLMQMQKE